MIWKIWHKEHSFPPFCFVLFSLRTPPLQEICPRSREVPSIVRSSELSPLAVSVEFDFFFKIPVLEIQDEGSPRTETSQSAQHHSCRKATSSNDSLVCRQLTKNFEIPHRWNSNGKSTIRPPAGYHQEVACCVEEYSLFPSA